MAQAQGSLVLPLRAGLLDKMPVLPALRTHLEEGPRKVLSWRKRT